MKPFQQQGNTQMVTANTSGSVPTPVQVQALTGMGPLNYLITNVGANTAWVGYGKDSATATANAVIPTTGAANGKFCVPVLPLTQISMAAPPNFFFTGITASGTSDIHVTPGEGM